MVTPINAYPLPPRPPERTADADEAGMTLRDYFAAKAMQSELAHILATGSGGNVAEMAAVNAYATADAMLKAREKKL